MPVVSALGNKDLKPKHWKKIFDMINANYNVGNPFTLTELISYDIKNYKDKIEDISSTASGEA